MFLKSKRRIVGSVMAALILFLAAALTTLYMANHLALKRQNAEMLDRYVDIYSLDRLPGDDSAFPPEEGFPGRDPSFGDSPSEAPGVLPPAEPSADSGGKETSLFRLSSFYSAAIASDGSVLAADCGRNELYREDEIVRMARAVLDGKKDSGMYGKLLYRIDVRRDYTLIAFIDTTLTENSMGHLLLALLAVGIVSICLFSAISTFLAREIIRPLEENDRRQKQFVSDAGHELKTPIAVISANAELLARELQENENPWLSNIQYENARMDNLVRELLELSRAENSAFEPEEFDFSKLTEQEVLPFESLAYESGLVLHMEIPEKIMINGNRSRLRQLISILVDNAISHSAGGNLVEVKLAKEHRRVLLAVSNSGPEIPAEAKEHLFDRFYRLDPARSGKEGHFGLGLPIAKAIAESHKGTIRVHCEEGRVVFEVSLPV